MSGGSRREALSQYLNAVVALEEIADRFVNGRCRGVAGNDAGLKIGPRLHAEIIPELHLIDFSADAVPGDSRDIRVQGNAGMGRNGRGI